MGEGEELWKEYCSFLDKPFSEQLEYSRQKRDEYFKKWRQTKMAAKLCPNGVAKFEDVPLTSYEDYPVLQEFGAKMETLRNTVSRTPGELWWDYYLRLSKQAAPILDGWMVEDFDFCLMTSGTSGKNKWFAYSKSFRGEWNSLIAYLVMTCSDRRGDTRLRKGDTYLNIVAPAPYASGFQILPIEKLLTPVPTRMVTDNMNDMKRKMYLIIKEIEKGTRIDLAGGIASTFYMMSQYFTDPETYFRDYYQSMNWGITKLALFFKYLKAKRKGKKYTKASEVLPVKGIGLGGYDTRLYLNHIQEEYGVIPTNTYGSTELGLIMYGHTERKTDLVPDLRNVYLEFLTEDGEVKQIDELKRGEVYDLIGTPLGTMLMRYDMKDNFRVVDIRDDGMPIFDFEGRKDQAVDVYGYFRISQTLAIKALCEAGVKETDKWCMTKSLAPKEHLLFLMEKEWEHSEAKAAELLFEAFRKIDNEFRNYVKDFNIKNPQEVIEIQYLKKGAFMRYTMKKMKDGVPIGNIKPPKIVVNDKCNEIELLRSV